MDLLLDVKNISVTEARSYRRFGEGKGTIIAYVAVVEKLI